MLRLANPAREQAVNIFSRALGVYPGDAEIIYNLGVTLQALGNAQKAAQSFASVLDINPQVCADEKSKTTGSA